MYDVTRGLTTLVGAGIAGLLLWLATQVGVGSVTRFWEAMGLVAAAGLVFALAHVLGGWAKGGRLRVSPATFLLGFLPVLVCTGWILMATQPGSGWHEGRIVSWSHSAGLFGLVHALGLWHGVLAFGFGLTLGLTLDTVPVPVAAPVAEPAETRRERARAVPADDRYDDDGYDDYDDETAVPGRRRSFLRRRRTADEPVQAERDAGYDGTQQPRTVGVGPATRRPPADDEEA